MGTEEVESKKRARLDFFFFFFFTIPDAGRRPSTFLLLLFFISLSIVALFLSSTWPAPASLRSREEAEAAAQLWQRESSERTPTTTVLQLLL